VSAAGEAEPSQGRKARRRATEFGRHDLIALSTAFEEAE
jgi:hypothetical protein